MSTGSSVAIAAAGCSSDSTLGMRALISMFSAMGLRNVGNTPSWMIVLVQEIQECPDPRGQVAPMRVEHVHQVVHRVAILGQQFDQPALPDVTTDVELGQPHHAQPLDREGPQQFTLVRAD